MAVARCQRGLVLVVIACLVAVAGCAGSDGDQGETGSAGATLHSEPDVSGGTVTSAGEVSTNDVRLCTAGDVRELVTSFVRAFNRGDSKRLDRMIAQEPDFEWYSVNAPGVRLNSGARHRSTLLAYFAGRHAQGERLKLRSFKFRGNASMSSKPYGNFEVELLRHARNLQPTSWVAKGAVRCYERRDRILAWSM